MKRTKEYQINRMLPLGRFIYLTKTGRFWHDGDVASFYLNWWNPLAWIFCLIFVPLQVITYGLAETKWYDLGIGISPYWKMHKRDYF